MAEPISLIASIISVGQGIGVLVSTIDNIRNAPESIKTIRNDLQSLEPSLQSLKSVIEQQGPDFAGLGPEIQANLTECHGACTEFKGSLDQWTRHSTDESSSFIDMINIGMFKQNRIKIMKGRVNQCIKTLTVILTTSTTLQVAHQSNIIKELAESMMEQFEIKLKSMLVESRNDRQALVKFDAEVVESTEEAEDKQLLKNDVEGQRRTIDVFEETAKKALMAVTLQRTKQKISTVKATDHSVVLTGMFNAGEKEKTIEQDISNVTAEKESFSAAGVFNDFNFKDFKFGNFGIQSKDG